MSWSRQKKYSSAEERRQAANRAQRRWRERHPDIVAAQLEEQRRNRERLQKLKENPCTDCGVRYPPYVMDWDHVRGEKKANVSDMRKRNTAIASILEEIAKCDLVCANCHRTRTYVRGL